MSHTLRPFRGTLPTIGERSYIDPMATVIGDVIIGHDCSIWPMVSIRADVNHIRIGHRTNIQDGSVLHVTHAHSAAPPEGFRLTIGDEVTVGHNATLHGCTIHNRVLVGMGSTVLDGAVLEEGVLLGAGSLVPPGKVLTGGYLWVGAPAKKYRPLTEAEQQWLAYSAQHYCELKNDYL
ncbi:gamma carbonic anhydrase family protein [Ectothiorhodospiraceae bacterium BW-2]|nr:gamma carbonic anhydrase family protein [Ectothiorhodospiraceae bacterium BW-2]